MTFGRLDEVWTTEFEKEMVPRRPKREYRKPVRVRLAKRVKRRRRSTHRDEDTDTDANKPTLIALLRHCAKQDWWMPTLGLFLYLILFIVLVSCQMKLARLEHLIKNLKCSSV